MKSNFQKSNSTITSNCPKKMSAPLSYETQSPLSYESQYGMFYVVLRNCLLVQLISVKLEWNSKSNTKVLLLKRTFLP